MVDYDFCYDVPFDIASKQEVYVLNRAKNAVFLLQRFNQNIIDLLLSSRNPETAVNIAVKDMSRNKLIQAIDAWSPQRKFHITRMDDPQDKIVATEVDHVSFEHKKLEFKQQESTYTICKKAYDKRICIKKDKEEIIIMKRSRELGPKTNYIKFLSNDLDIKLALCILHAYEIGV